LFVGAARGNQTRRLHQHFWVRTENGLLYDNSDLQSKNKYTHHHALLVCEGALTDEYFWRRARRSER